MDTDLKSYVKTYNMLNHSQCDVILNELTSVKFHRHQFQHYDGTLISSDIDPKVFTVDENNFHIDATDFLMKQYWSCLSQYLKEDINFEWYNNWNGFTKPKFNWYNSNTGMKNHCDHIWDIFDGSIKGIPVLSMIALLNDDFDGGEFVMFDTESYNLKKGELIIFPSIFLFPHKVNPVTNGERISMVSWVY